MDNQIMDEPIKGSGLSWGTRGNTVIDRIAEHNRIQQIVKDRANHRGAEIAPNRSIQKIQLGREYYHR